MERVDCIDCLNSDCLIKQNIRAFAGTDFLAKKHMQSCKKSQSVILEGAPIYGLYFVYSGKMKIYKTGINGREQIVRLAKNGEVVGHRGFGSGQFSEINAEALESTVLCNFSVQDLMAMFKEIPMLTIAFMIFYAEELNRSETKVRKIAQMSVREKVIDTLLYLHRKFGLDDGALDIQLSRRDIANYAGTTDEQVIRVLSSLKKENIIETEGKKIKVLQIDKLKNEISEHMFFISS